MLSYQDKDYLENRNFILEIEALIKTKKCFSLDKKTCLGGRALLAKYSSEASDKNVYTHCNYQNFKFVKHDKNTFSIEAFKYQVAKDLKKPYKERNYETLKDDPYKDIDIEIRELVRRMNKIEGIETIESCYGHHNGPCRIWFKAKNGQSLNNFLGNHLNCVRTWRVILDTWDIQATNTEILCYLESNFQDYDELDISIPIMEKNMLPRSQRT